MDERRYYRVAEHCFSLEAETSVFDSLPNYSPFRISERETDALRFSLKVQLSSQLSTLNAQLSNPLFIDKSDPDMPRIEVYHLQDVWRLTFSLYRDSPVVGELQSSEDFSHGTVVASPQHLAFAVNNAVMMLYAFATAPYMTLEMHASVIVRHDKGYLFLGKSGTGKSTHARLWLQAFPSAWLLNDDNPVLRLLNGEIRIYGTPWSGKTPCYKNASAPVAGIVQLYQAPANSMRLLRLPEAYAYLLSSTSGLKILPETMDHLYNTISALVQQLPCYGLECLPDTDAAQLCFDTVNNN